MKAAFIDDGYTLTKTFEQNDFFDQVIVEYRPLLRTDILRQQTKVRSLMRPGNDGQPTEKGILESQKFSAECVVRQLVSWDVRKRDGTSVDITPENVLKLQSHLQGLLLDLIWGELPPDADREADSESHEEAAAKN